MINAFEYYLELAFLKYLIGMLVGYAKRHDASKRHRSNDDVMN